jgi:hypothetical protein
MPWNRQRAQRRVSRASRLRRGPCPAAGLGDFSLAGVSGAEGCRGPVPPVGQLETPSKLPDSLTLMYPDVQQIHPVSEPRLTKTGFPRWAAPGWDLPATTSADDINATTRCIAQLRRGTCLRTVSPAISNRRAIRLQSLGVLLGFALSQPPSVRWLRKPDAASGGRVGGPQSVIKLVSKIK